MAASSPPPGWNPAPPGRGRGTTRWPWFVAGGLVLLVLAGVVAVVAVLVLSGGDGSSVSASAGRAATATATRQPRRGPVGPVPFGQTVTVRDLDGNRAEVTTLLLVVKHPPRSALVTSPRPGFHLVGLRIRLVGKGPGAFDDYVDTDTQILSGGRAYDSLAHDYSGCPAVDSDHRLARFEEESGCLLFSIPISPKPSAVRYRPAGPSGPDAAIWTLR